MLYFAYGSNLHHFQMKRRCKDSVFLKKINLKDFHLTFRSRYRAADIEPKKNSTVPGGLFEISKNVPMWLVGPGIINTNPLGGFWGISMLIFLCLLYFFILKKKSKL